MTKSQIKDALAGIALEIETQIVSAESQVKYLQEKVVQKVDLDDELAELRSSLGKIKTLTDALGADEKPATEPEKQPEKGEAGEKSGTGEKKTVAPDKKA